ncbi:hypothetical protein [Streptomyces vinaceus]
MPYSCDAENCAYAPDDYEHANYCVYSEEFEDGEDAYGPPLVPVIP